MTRQNPTQGAAENTLAPHESSIVASAKTVLDALGMIRANHDKLHAIAAQNKGTGEAINITASSLEEQFDNLAASLAGLVDQLKPRKLNTGFNQKTHELSEEKRAIQACLRICETAKEQIATRKLELQT